MTAAWVKTPARVSPEEIRQLLGEADAALVQIYGRAFDELFHLAYQRGYADGREEGLKQGRTEGRRRAKGLRAEPKRRGNQPKIKVWIRNAIMMHVGNKPKDMTIEAAVKEVLCILSRGQEIIRREDGEEPEELPSLKRAIEAYYRGTPEQQLPTVTAKFIREFASRTAETILI